MNLKIYLCPSVCLFSQVVYEGVDAVLVAFVAEIYLCPSACFSSQVFYEEGAALAALVYGNSQPALKSLFGGHHA